MRFEPPSSYTRPGERLPYRRRKDLFVHQERYTMAEQAPAKGYTNRVIGQDVLDLPEHIKFLSMPIQGPSGDINGFDIEFKFIERRCETPDFRKTFIAAEQPHNRGKNRWTNVLPPDETRVELTPSPSVTGSDYVNANYVSICLNPDDDDDDLLVDSEYISTQGPLPNTVCDFWRMVWEQNSRIIVMLTKEIESGRVKCVKYWPDKDMLYDGIKVVCDDIDSSIKELIVRKFTITNEMTKEQRKVVHYQYKEWPDHGLPASTKVFLKMVKAAVRQDGDGPIIVHCSAGIGRSGTFCAVHSIVKMMNEYVFDNHKMPPINIVETVLLLRDQRPGMVQTKEQFMFCYLAVQEEYLKLQEWLKKEQSKKKKRKDSEDN